MKSSAEVIIIMGVAGSGKTTVGEELAQRLNYQFADGDSFHSKHNKEKMASGHPLTDEDRRPWLQSMRQAIGEWLQNGQRHVLACSALKHVYREILDVDDSRVLFVFLDVDREELERRLEARKHHYMKAGMLESQLKTLEPPGKSEALVVNGNEAPDVIVGEILKKLPALQTRQK